MFTSPLVDHVLPRVLVNVERKRRFNKVIDKSLLKCISIIVDKTN